MSFYNLTLQCQMTRMPQAVIVPARRKADLMGNSGGKDPGAEAARRKARLAREAELLEEGRADIRAGRCLSGEALETWLDHLTTVQEVPVAGRSSGDIPR